MRRVRCLVGIAIVGASLAPVALSADEPRGARWVAEDALIYIETAKPEDLLDRALSQRIQKLLHAVPNYDAALKRPEFVQFQGVVEYVSGLLDTTWDEGLRKLAGGGAVLGVEVQDKTPRVYLLITPKDPDFLAKAHAKLLELARKDASDKGNPDPVKEADYRGVHGYAIGKQEAHAIVDGTLLIANGGDTIKLVIDRMKDGLKTPITGNAEWKSRRAAIPAEAFAWSFARLDRLRAIDAKRFGFGGDGKPDAGAVFLFGPWLEALQKAPWASAALTWNDQKLAAQLTLGNPAGGYSNAMGKYRPSNGVGAAAPIWTKSTIASLSLWRDLAAIWEVRSEIFPPETVAGLAQLDSTAGTFFGGRDFGTGVLGAIGANWRLVLAEQDHSQLNPAPEYKLPALALVVDLKENDEDFATRLKSAFQSFIGLVNLGAAQSKAPPLLQGSEQVDGVTVLTAKYLPEKDRPANEPQNARYNFTPSAAQVGQRFILSSSLGLARELVTTLKSGGNPTSATLLAQASGSGLAKVLELNKARLITQSMLDRGNDKAAAESEVALLLQLVRYLGQGKLSVDDTADQLRFALEFNLDK